jgi:hypothetical protein
MSLDFVMPGAGERFASLAMGPSICFSLWSSVAALGEPCFAGGGAGTDEGAA